jgi:uncharacterized membrane protein (DUF2068 family)
MGKKTERGVKVVALIEASKGIFTLIICLSLFSLVGTNIQNLIIDAARHLNVDTNSYYFLLLVKYASKITTDNIYAVIGLGFVYALIRFVEFFGLWKGYVWTEWFALISGSIYLPFELYESYQHTNGISIGVLLINLLIVGYMFTVIKNKRKNTELEIDSPNY